MAIPDTESNRELLKNASAEVLNDLALLETIEHMRSEYDPRLAALENEVVALKEIVEGQSRMIGVLTQQQWGSGPTVRE